MHYKNGREAKNGDKVLLAPTWGPPVIGILYDAVAGNDCCNGRLAPISPNDPCPNLAECLHIDDALSRAAAPVEQMAEKMYEAYCAATGGKAFNGADLPNWKAFRADPSKRMQSGAWIAAAKAVA